MDLRAVLQQLLLHPRPWVRVQPIHTISHKNSLYNTSSEWRQVEGRHDNLLKMSGSEKHISHGM